MTATILLFILGLVILIAGADLLVRSAARLAAAMIEVEKLVKSRSKEDKA
jgi:hypothetical protein